MSDISIPGVPGTSKYNTEKMVEELMAVERIGMERMESELEETKIVKKAWQTVNRSLARVRDASKALYGFENPFNDRISNSSDESILTATATREASPESTEITVESLAGRDRFLSGTLDRDFEVNEGRFTFTVGEKDISFNFRGGSLKDFANTLNSRSKDILSARVVPNTSTTQVILIESAKTGAENTMRFSDDALEWGLETGLLKTSDTAARNFAMSTGTFNRLEKPLTDSIIQFEGGAAMVLPGGEAQIPITPVVVSKANLTLEIEYEVEVLPYNYTPPTPPKGPAIPDADGILYQGIEISNESSRVLVPEWSPAPPPEKNDDMNVFFINGGGSTFPLTPVTDGAGTQKISIKLSDYLDSVDALQVRNANTHRQIQIKSVKIFDPEARGDYTPLNPVETASDAVIYMEGIEVRRDTNTIDDLLLGVTLNLKNSSEDPVKLDVEPDREGVKEAIIALVGYYDELLSEINIVTGRSEDIIEEISYLTDEERTSAYDRLGLLQGDMTLMRLKSSLQTILMNPYPTSLGRELALLDQIGVSTNSVGSSSGSVNRSRLRGYIEIDEEILDQALESNLPAIKELFGQDTDQDLIVNEGVAYKLDTYVKNYVETGGLIATRLATIDGRISRTSTSIETEQEKLIDLEQKYKQQFATMEGSLNTLEQSSQQIDNFNNSSNR
ncbi:MAG: flagellar filament capping protein FliD [Spirochaetales bacterium]|jgi:flagellar hook-associated protein 2|nr:flagellar filament capping protein FliD [Spirochaetales bacterium]